MSEVEMESRDELREAQEQRSKKYGIGIKEDGHLTPPKDYPEDESLYADPVNYKYPMDTEERAYAAIRYWARFKSGYTPAEQKIIEARMKKLAKKYGIEPNFSKKIVIDDIELSGDATDIEADDTVILSANALKPGVWKGIYKFDSDVIRDSAPKWLGKEVLNMHDSNNPLAVVGSITKSEASADGVLKLYFTLNNTTAGNDVKKLIRENHRFSVSVGFEGDTISNNDGTVSVTSIEPDHLALLRFGRQAVEGAHVEVVKMEENERIKELEEKIAELESEISEYQEKIKEYEKVIEEKEKENILSKMEQAALEFDTEKVSEMSLPELKEYYYSLLEQKVLSTSDVSEPVKLTETKVKDDNPFRVKE